MSQVFDLLIAEKIVSSAAVPAFARYMADGSFKERIDSRASAYERVSLVTLAGPLPENMGRMATISQLYDMRHRFRVALERLTREAV